MMKIATKVKILNSFGVFNTVRSFYYKLDTYNKNILSFYRRFIKPGSLCFDVGANIGRKTDIFLKLGARVIAVEPQPDCFAFLKNKYRRNKQVTVIDKALDKEEGGREMYICDVNSLSSMSAEWIEKSKSARRAQGFHWDKKITIQTTTLDQLIAAYGKPDYCKIDVEGYELNVLQGLSEPIDTVSFEIAPESMDMVKKCINCLSGIGVSSFNLTDGDNSVHFVSQRWSGKDEIISTLQSRPVNRQYGEIFATIK